MTSQFIQANALHLYHIFIAHRIIALILYLICLEILITLVGFHSWYLV